jgi:hypothetical protein
MVKNPIDDIIKNTSARVIKNNYDQVKGLKATFTEMKKELENKGEIKIEHFIALLDIVEQIINLI